MGVEKRRICGGDSGCVMQDGLEKGLGLGSFRVAGLEGLFAPEGVAGVPGRGGAGSAGVCRLSHLPILSYPLPFHWKPETREKRTEMGLQFDEAKYFSLHH